MTIPAEKVLGLYRTMLRVRRFEELIVARYAEQEMRTPVHLCLGQEGVAAGVCAHLLPDDVIFSTHRSHGHCIAKGVALDAIAAELYGREEGCSRGRGGSMHLADPDNGVPGSTAIVGGSMPLATGAALAFRLRQTRQVAVAFFGDGAAEEGSFHESLNFAALHRLAVVFVCENNGYATNSPLAARQPPVGIAAKGAGYGIPALQVDGNDVLAVHDAAGEAIARARAREGPTLLECLTYRWKGHVGPECDVPLGCRPGSELASWLDRCPIQGVHARIGAAWPDLVAELERIDAEETAAVAAAFTRARQGRFPEAASLLDHVE